MPHLVIALSCVFLLSACEITGGRLPQHAKAFRVSLDLRIDGSPYDFDYQWRCVERWNWAGQVWQWVADADFPIAKEIDKDRIALLGVPSDPCSPFVEGDFQPDIAIFKESKGASAFDLFPGVDGHGYGNGGVVTKGFVLKESDYRPNPPFTKREQQVRELWEKSRFEYFAIIGVVIPESIWSRSPALRDRFVSAKKVLVAEPLPNRRNAFPGTISFEPRIGRFLTVINTTRINGVWVHDGENPSAVIRYRKRTDGDPSIASDRGIWVRYQEVTFSLDSGAQEIYDPDRKVLIRFFRASSALSF